MSLVLKLEAMAGDRVADTCNEMCHIAERLNICVEVKFNDVTLMSYRGGDPEVLVQSFAEQVGSDYKCKFAAVRGD